MKHLSSFFRHLSVTGLGLGRLMSLAVLLTVLSAGYAPEAQAQNPIANQARANQQRKQAAAAKKKAATPTRPVKAQTPVRRATTPAKAPATPKQTATKPVAPVDSVATDSCISHEQAAEDLPKAKEAQKKEQVAEKPQPNEVVEQPAGYPGGEAALMRDIANNLIYPAVAQENGLQGSVIAKLTIGKTGEVEDIAIVKKLSPECDQAAINSIRKLKRFTPARQNGHPVAVTYTLPIRFRL